MGLFKHFGLAILLAAFSGAAQAQPLMKEMALGAPDAPVTILEYASLTCPHCAAFHVATIPDLKKDFIDAGKVRLVYRDYPLDPIAVKAAQLARCVPEASYFPLLDLLFRQQRQWGSAPDPIAALIDIGKIAGLAEEQARACMNDKALEDYILNQRLEGQNKHNVSATPTLIINGKAYSGARSPAQMAEIINPILAGGQSQSGYSPEVERNSYLLGVAFGVLLAFGLVGGGLIWWRRRKTRR